jgi:hypothetical protein
MSNYHGVAAPPPHPTSEFQANTLWFISPPKILCTLEHFAVVMH